MVQRRMGDSLAVGIENSLEFVVDGPFLTGAAPKGTACTAHARLEEIVDGRKLRFAVEVVAEDTRTIGVGTHERRVVNARS